MKAIKKLTHVGIELILATLSLAIALPVFIVKVMRNFINCVMKTILFMVGYSPEYIGLTDELFEMRGRVNRFASDGIDIYRMAMKGELINYLNEKNEGR